MKKNRTNEDTEVDLHAILNLGDLGLDAGDGLLEWGVDRVVALVQHESATIQYS